MKNLLWVWLCNSAAVFFTAKLIPGIETKSVWTAVWAAFALGIINTVLKPVFVFFSFPFILLSLGLFTLVINAFLLYVVSWLVEGFRIHSFVSAIFASITISIISWLIRAIFE